MENQEQTVPQIKDSTNPLSNLRSDKGRLILIVAVVIVILVVAFTSAGPQPATKVPTASKEVAPQRPATPEQVRAFSQQLQKETAEMAVERQRAESMRAEAQKVVGQQSSPYAQAGAAPVQYSASTQFSAVTASPAKTAASNVVVSFRHGSKQEAAPGSNQSEIADLIEAQKAALRETLKASPLQASTPAAAPSPVEQKEGGQSKLATLNSAIGDNHRLFEGTMIEAVLVNRLNGSFAGPVIVLVSNPVFTHDREHILIPQGSRVIGTAAPVAGSGQKRLAISFHRLIMPDGFSIDLDQFKGLNAIGETGLKDQINHHYVELFGTSVAIGLVSGFTGFGTGSTLTADGADQYRQGVARSIGQSSNQVLNQQLTSVLPTITIREGHRVRVYISQDLDLPAYEDHRMKGNL